MWSARHDRANAILGERACAWDTPRMANLTLVIGNKNYSSWSLRPWFLLTAFDIPFTELRIPLYEADSQQRILTVSPSGKVPALRDGDGTVWDSLAICEYVAE